MYGADVINGISVGRQIHRVYGIVSQDPGKRISGEADQKVYCPDFEKSGQITIIFGGQKYFRSCEVLLRRISEGVWKVFCRNGKGGPAHAMVNFYVHKREQRQRVIGEGILEPLFG